jgi:hypothetical protein
MKAPSEAQKKRPYQAPKLFVYGDLTEMTKSKGPRDKLDGGTQLGMRRTGA